MEGPVPFPRYFYPETDTPEPQFLTFCTSDTLARWLLGPSRPCGSYRVAPLREHASFFVTHKYTLLIWAQKRAKMGTFGTFSDLSQPLDGFKTSDLVRCGQDTSPDGVQGLIHGHGSQITAISLRGVPKNTHLSSSGPLEALFRASAIF